jgi:hypothetical protein
MKNIIYFSFFLLFSFVSFSQTQFEMNEEAKSEYLNSSHKLDSLILNIKKSYSEDSLFIEKFKLGQIHWKNYVESMIEARFPDENKLEYYGSVYPLCYYYLLKDYTDKRIEEISIWITGVKEGEACPGSVKFK